MFTFMMDEHGGTLQKSNQFLVRVRTFNFNLNVGAHSQTSNLSI